MSSRGKRGSTQPAPSETVGVIPLLTGIMEVAAAHTKALEDMSAKLDALSTTVGDIGQRVEAMAASVLTARNYQVSHAHTEKLILSATKYVL